MPVVWDVLVDASRYPAWLVGARRARVLDCSWPQPGSSFQHAVGAGPVEVHDATTVVESQPGRVLQLVVRARPLLEADVRFELHAQDAGTRLTMDEVPRGGYRLLSPFVAPLVKVRNDRSLARLAEQIECGGG